MFAMPTARLIPRARTAMRLAQPLPASLMRPATLRMISSTSVRWAEDPRAGAPGSKSVKHAAQNVKEDVADVIHSASTSVTGGKLSPQEESNLKNAYKQPVRGADHDTSITDAIKTGAKINEQMISAVPNAAKLWGTAGSIPFVATTIASIWCTRSACLSVGNPEAVNHFISLAGQAEYAQITISAVLLSFVGAMHWGLEFAGYGGHHGNLRYGLGVIPFVAGWASLALSPTVQLGLITQWLSWVGAWLIDLKATEWGWTPRWYSTYRFWLTSIVGAGLFTTLAGTRYYQPNLDLSSRHSPEQRVADIIKPDLREEWVEEKSAPHGGSTEAKIFKLPDDTEVTTVMGSKVNSPYYVVLQEVKPEEEEEEEEEVEGDGAGAGDKEGAASEGEEAKDDENKPEEPKDEGGGKKEEGEPEQKEEASKSDE